MFPARRSVVGACLQIGGHGRNPARAAGLRERYNRGMAMADMGGKKLLALVAVVAGLLFWVLGDEPLSDEERVREAIRQVAEGAEQADLRKTLEPVSTVYRDADGLNRDELKGYLFMEFRRRGPMHTMIGPIGVTFSEDGQTATASFTAVVGEGAEGVVGELLPQSGEAFQFEVQLQEEEEFWRITSHERADLAGERVPLPGE